MSRICTMFLRTRLRAPQKKLPHIRFRPPHPFLAAGQTKSAGLFSERLFFWGRVSFRLIFGGFFCDIFDNFMLSFFVAVV